MRKAFCRWRLRVWDERLKRYRAIMDSAWSRTPEETYWAGKVTKALAKRVKWRKRLGITPRSGGPVSKGQPFIRGESGPELFIAKDPPGLYDDPYGDRR